MKRIEYWNVRKGVKYGIMNAMSKLNSYNEKEMYLTKLCGNGTNYSNFKFYYNERWDIKVRLFPDSSYDMI